MLWKRNFTVGHEDIYFLITVVVISLPKGVKGEL